MLKMSPIKPAEQMLGLGSLLGLPQRPNASGCPVTVDLAHNAKISRRKAPGIVKLRGAVFKQQANQ